MNMDNNTLLYIAIVLAVLAFVLYEYMKYRESRFEAKKQNRKKKAICEDLIILSEYTDQRLQINLMALDAARKMADAAAKSPSYGQKSD